MAAFPGPKIGQKAVKRLKDIFCTTNQQNYRSKYF